MRNLRQPLLLFFSLSFSCFRTFLAPLNEPDPFDQSSQGNLYCVSPSLSRTAQSSACTDSLIGTPDSRAKRTSCSFSPADPLPRADLEICYPTVGETLWDVGKRYGVSPDGLAAANGLSADAPGDTDSLRDVRYLLIP